MSLPSAISLGHLMRKALVFEDFSGGDVGRSRPATSNPTQFRAINAWVYPGGVGPRPPFQDIRPSGLPQQKLVSFDVVRGTSGFLYLMWAFENKAIYKMGTTGAGWNFGDTVTSLGSMTNVPITSTNIGPQMLYPSILGHGAIADPVAATITNLTNMPAAISAVRFGERLAASSGDGILRFSAPSSFNDWPAANLIQVGATQFICDLYVQRNNLLIPKLEGDLWTITGTLGVNETLRRSDNGVRHNFPTFAPGAVTAGSSLWYCGTRQMVQYTGAQLVLVERPDVPPPPGTDVQVWDVHPGAVAPLSDDDEFFLLGAAELAGTSVRTVWAQAFRPNKDNWTRHVIPVTQYRCDSVGTRSQFTSGCIKVNRTDHEGMCFFSTTSDTAGNNGSASQVFVCFSNQEFPLVTNATAYGANYITDTVFDAKSGVPVTATFRTSDTWAGLGEQIQVNEVVVDYSFNSDFTPSSTYNKFDISVEALQNPGSTAVRTSTAISFTAPAVTTSTPDGVPLVRGQAKFQFGDQGAGVGFRILLDNWRGILVHRITANVEVSPGLF